MAITLPYRFDTCNIWRTILKGAFSLNAVLVFGILYTLLVRHQWGTSLGLALCELIVFGFTRVFIRFQEGSVGTLTSDQVVIAPNVLLGIVLPGPNGTYALDRFSAVRVEFRPGSVSTSPNAGGPHERFYADPGIIGRRVVTYGDGTVYTVVGVMPEGLDYPQGTDFWAPVVSSMGKW